MSVLGWLLTGYFTALIITMTCLAWRDGVFRRSDD